MSDEAKKGHDMHAIGKGKQKSCGKPSNFQQHSSNHKQQQRGEAQGRSHSPKKIASIVVKRIPRVNVQRMALLAINAADRTTSQAYAKTANSVVSEKRYMSLTSPSRTSQKPVTMKAITFL